MAKQIDRERLINYMKQRVSNLKRANFDFDTICQVQKMVTQIESGTFDIEESKTNN